MPENTFVSQTARILEGVLLNDGVRIGDFALIGVVPDNADDDCQQTLIGAGANIRSHTVIYAGSTLGEGCHTGHGVMIREHTSVGPNVSIGTSTVVEHHVRIAEGARIHSQAFVPEFSVLEEEAWLGPRVCITNAKFPASRRSKEFLRGVTIGRRARVGANATLLPGITVGADSLIGAGSVVTRDVPPRAVMVGNPARQIKTVDELSYDEGGFDPPYGS